MAHSRILTATSTSLVLLLAASLALAAAKPKTPATRPTDTPSAVHDLKPIKLTSINVSAGVPSYLLPSGDAAISKSGLRGFLQTKGRDFLAKDFTLDVYMHFESPDDQDFLVGIGEQTADGGKTPRAVLLKWQRSGVVEMSGLQADIPKPKLPDKTEQVLFRIEKAGDAATFWVACRAHGAYKVVVNQKIADLPHAAPFLTNENSSLFFGGQGTITAVGLNVADAVASGSKPSPASPASKPTAPEKPAAPEKPIAQATPPQTRPAEPIDQQPLIPLAHAAASLPSWLRVNHRVLADEVGLLGGETRTVSNELFAHDFVFDLLFKFADERDESSFLLGLGENGRNGGWVTNSLAVRVQGPAHKGRCTYGTREQDGLEQQLGSFGASPGPHLFRLESKSGTLTMSVSPDYKGTFDPIFNVTLGDFRRASPFLSRVNGGIFFALDREDRDDRFDKVRFLATRLVVDGKPVENKTPAPASSHDEVVDKTPMFSLAGQAGLPSWLTASAKSLAGAEGIRGGELRTVDHDLLARDWTFDLQYQFKSERDESIFLIGLGENGRNGGWITNTISSRVHGPGHGGLATVTTPDLQSQEPVLGHTGRSTGSNLFRLQKRGNTLTLAIMTDWDGGPFRPSFTRTLPDLAKAGPFLNRSNASLFIAIDSDRDMQHLPVWKAVRFVVDGKPAGSGSSDTVAGTAASRPATLDKAAAAATEKLLAGEEGLIRQNGKLPAFLVAQKDPVFDAKGGVQLRDNQLRTSQSDFINHDFTFDVLFQTLDGTFGPVVGIGEYGHDGGRILNSVCAVGNGWERNCPLLISGKEDVQLGQLPRSSPGPHLLRFQKRGDTLTIGLCPSFAGRFEPLFLYTVPSLKSVAPFLTEKNSQLFISDGGTIEAVRLIVDGEVYESLNPQVSAPAYVVEGQPLHQPLTANSSGLRFRLDAGPKGLALSPAGEMTWTPAGDQVGRHELLVTVTRGKQTASVRAAVEVVSATDAAAVGGKLDQVASLYRLPLTTATAHLTTGIDGKSMLLLDGDRLRRLEADGITVSQTMKLPAKYVKLEERPDYFVALSDEKESLDLLDKKTLQPLRSIRMNYHLRHDLALQPGKPTCYVSVQTIVDQARDVIVIVDEATGEVREPDNFVGRWIRTSPDGRLLFAGYKATHARIRRPFPEQANDFAAAEFGSVDLLLAYDISGAAPKLVAKKDAPGVNGTGIALTPDGTHVAYTSESGYPVGSRNVPLFDVRDFTKRPTAYPTKESNALCSNVAFHPMLPIAATPAAAGGVCFNRDTGDPLPELIKAAGPQQPDTKVHHVEFSTDGRSLLLFCEAAKGEPSVQRVRLALSAQQVEMLKQVSPPGKPVAP